MIDGIMEEYEKHFMLHYNFPPFSVGETKSLRSPGRREIGHGALAERALKQILPNEEKFPYTIRTVSEILESNGSSSMATVCGGTLSLMDAGVPIKNPVAGIAMGLIKEGNNFVILSDILGDEDHLGDMDFKVAGTKDGITSVQMDIKITGITEEILRKALEQAREGRLHILGKMLDALPAPRADISQYAPRIIMHKISVDKIGALIGPGGKNIRKITDATGVKIDITDDGIVHIATNDSNAAKEALKMVKELTVVPEVGKYYKGTVVKIMEFGAFVEILPGQDGLLHISQIDNKRIKQVTDVLKEGDEVVVKLLEIDPDTGKMRLSRKEAFGHEKEVEEI
jgi:polyribonucleotide nucleotidyltransferase